MAAVDRSSIDERFPHWKRQCDLLLNLCHQVRILHGTIYMFTGIRLAPGAVYLYILPILLFLTLLLSFVGLSTHICSRSL